MTLAFALLWVVVSGMYLNALSAYVDSYRDGYKDGFEAGSCGCPNKEEG